VSGDQLGLLVEIAAAVTDPHDQRVVWLRRDGSRKISAGRSTIAQLRELAASERSAWLARRMFSVRAAPDVLVVDVDDPAHAPAVRDWSSACASRGVEVVEVRSGRPGHLHLWCRPRDEASFSLLRDTAESLGLELRTGNYMRPPGSHSDFGPVEVVGGLERAASILAPPPSPPAWAGRRDKSVASPSRNQVRSAMPELSRATLAVLRDGDGNADRSRTLQRVVCGMVVAGWSLDAAWDCLRNGRFRGVEKLNEKLARHGPDTAYRYLAHCWANAVEYTSSRPAPGLAAEVRHRLESVQLAADCVEWSGETGANEWMVLHVLLSTAHRGGCEVHDDGSVTLYASERQLAEGTCLSRQAVHGALGRLCARGWITKLRTGAGPLASLWRIGDGGARSVVPLPQPQTGEPPSGGVVVNGKNLRVLNGPLQPGHDLFRRRGAGVNGYRLLRALLLWGPQTSVELAARLGLHRGSVQRLLRSRLGACGFVQRLGSRWDVVREAVLEDPASEVRTGKVAQTALVAGARKLGVEGLGLKQRFFHLREREEYRKTPSFRLAALTAGRPLEGMPQVA